MDALVIENGVVVDAVVVESLDFDPGPSRTLIAASVGGIGWRYDDGELTPPDLGGTPQPQTPKTVSAAQGGIALIRAGKMAAVLAAANAPDTPPEVKWAFDKATLWSLDSPAFNYLADKAGITPEDRKAMLAEATGIAA